MAHIVDEIVAAARRLAEDIESAPALHDLRAKIAEHDAAAPPAGEPPAESTEADGDEAGEQQEA